MNKIIRIVVVLTFLTVIVALGMKGTVWANKLGDGNQASAANGLYQGLSAGVRLNGTVPGGNTNVTLEAGLTATVGRCAEVELDEFAPTDIRYTASVSNNNNLSNDYPGDLDSCLIRIHAIPTDVKNLDADVEVCFPPNPPGQTGIVYYWDGTHWEETTTTVNEDGYSCGVVPEDAPSFTYTAMFD